MLLVHALLCFCALFALFDSLLVRHACDLVFEFTAEAAGVVLLFAFAVWTGWELGVGGRDGVVVIVVIVAVGADVVGVMVHALLFDALSLLGGEGGEVCVVIVRVVPD